MKKIFSLMLAAVLALGLTTAAWAAAEEPGDPTEGAYTDDDRITIEKCYRLVNDGTVSRRDVPLQPDDAGRHRFHGDAGHHAPLHRCQRHAHHRL